MNSIKTAAALVGIACVAALSTSAVSAETVISNPIYNYAFGYLAGAPLQGGQQTQFIGETFKAPITGALTDFQFTLGSSSITSVYGAVYAWDGSKPTTKLWQSPAVSAGAGLLDFSPVAVNVTQGQAYVAFLSTYGIADNTGTATVNSCLSYSGCNDINSDPYIGDLVWKTIYFDTKPLEETWSKAGYLDATFSATFTAAVPEPSTWAMMILGFAGVGFMAYRRKSKQAWMAA
jgi:hypothetical protein